LEGLFAERIFSGWVVARRFFSGRIFTGWVVTRRLRQPRFRRRRLAGFKR
jgi:hypothetical protein